MSSRLGRHTAVTFSGLMTANVLGYAFHALVSRTLGVEGYGAFSSLFAILILVSAPALVGKTVVAKLASDHAFDPARLSGLVRAIDRVTVAVALSGAAALAVLSIPVAAFLHMSDPLLVTITAASLCGALALPFLRGILQGTSAFGPFALSAITENFGKALLAPVFALGAGLRGALGGMALAYVAAATYAFVAARPHGRGIGVPLPLRSIARPSLTVAAIVFCVNVLVFYDVILAKRYLDPHTAGLYGAAALSGRALFTILEFIPTVLLPQAAGRSARGERTRGLFGMAFGLAVGIVLCTLGLFAAFPHLVMAAIAGRAFAGSAGFVVPYGYALGMLALANLTATYNIARGRMRFVVPLALVAAGEIVAVVLRHRSAADLLLTICVGHTLALLACSLSLGGRTVAVPPGTEEALTETIR
jgi:O-antigen/teichoic acid export membrane protein